MVLRRINKEIFDIEKSPSSTFTVTVDPLNPFEWTFALFGPPETPYAGGMFLIKVGLPSDYPFKKPIKVVFLTKIYHPNITVDGVYNPCCATPNILCGGEWSPAYTVAKVIKQVEGHLVAPGTQCVVNTDVNKVYKEDRAKFEKIAREWTRKYAQ